MALKAIFFNVHTMIDRPAGCYRISSFLREQGWDAEVIDYTIHWTLDELKDLIRSRGEIKLFGFSSFFSVWNQTVEDLVIWIKEAYPDSLTVVGGQGVENIKSQADYFISGFGENSLLAILKSTRDEIKTDPEWAKRQKRVIRHEYYPSAPMPQLKIIYEDRDYLRPQEWMALETSRGCYFECAFCQYPILGVRDDYTRTAEDFEIHLRDAYDRFGIQNYYIADETFNDRTDKIIKYADVVERMPFRPYFSGFIRADLLISRPEQKEHLARMGMIGQYYGIETTNHATGKIVGKGMSPDKLLPGILEIRDYFKKQGPYRGQLSFIIGLPKETEETLAKTFQWLIDNWQGESVCAFPLGIPTDPMYYKLSKMSREWAKLGYRPSTIPALSNPNGNMTHLENNDWSAGLDWENDHMNLRRADELYNQFEAEVVAKNDFRIPPWNIGEHMYCGRTLEESLDIHARTKTKEDPTIYINRYKEKKINNDLK
jgi:hypothetical protein